LSPTKFGGAAHFACSVAHGLYVTRSTPTATRRPSAPRIPKLERQPFELAWV
jgi:hypothetical protein